MPDFDSYVSPFSWRYATPTMRRLWSEMNRRRLWRRVWVALAEVEAEYGLLNQEQVADLRAHIDAVDLPRALEIEAEIDHDLMAELLVFAEQCPVGGGHLHLGATSMDIEDNAEAIQIREALALLLGSLSELLNIMAERIEAWAELPLIAYSHLQPAEPSTLGYRMAQYARDLLSDWRALNRIRSELRGKGFKGAVGTRASYAELLGIDNLNDFEARLSALLELPFHPITSQTSPRRQDYEVMSGLASLGISLYKFAFDLRILQSPSIGELAEPFGEKQIGSSAMPFKRNPIKAEKVNSLARSLAQLPRLAWDNAAHSLLERTLDDSANRRSMLPEAFLTGDEILQTSIRIIRDLYIDRRAMKDNLAAYGPFAATERVLMALGKAGVDRQTMHHRLRQHAMEAWAAVREGRSNPLSELVAQDSEVSQYLSAGELTALFEIDGYVGDAPARARALAQEIRDAVPESPTQSGE
ncbi:MAG: adenylosuccinate lyase [Anaerolineales bacterium]